MPKKREQQDIRLYSPARWEGDSIVDPLVTVEAQREADIFSGQLAERVFVKLYVAARESGLLAVISDRDWKTLCTLATYMDGEGYCHPSQAELAKAMGCSRQMANERVRSLAEFRFQGQQVLLVVKKQRSGKGKWARNGYKVLPISRLRIYDSAEPRERTDSNNDTSKVPRNTVSSSLDTDTEAEGTVSSPTVTVPLDTNKNQSLEQDLNVSNFEGSYNPVDKSETTADGGEAYPSDESSTDIAEQATALGKPRLDHQASEDGQGESAHHASPGKPQELRRRDPTAAEPPPSADATGAAEPRSGHGCRHGLRGTAAEREQLAAYLGDFSAELGDEAPLSSTITRALNVFTTAGVPVEQWSTFLYEARVITQERTAQITKQARVPTSVVRHKNKMPYYFRVLERLVGLRPVPAVRSPITHGRTLE